METVKPHVMKMAMVPGPVTCNTNAACDDGNECTTNICNAATLVCQSSPVANGTACDDGSTATTNDTCQAGVCVGGTGGGCTSNTQCDDSNDCTSDSCNLSTGVCSNTLVAPGTACGDPTNNQCNDPDTCDEGGNCLANAQPDGATCDDGNAETSPDTCQSSVCVGATSGCTSNAECDDGNLCTLNTCNVSTGQCVITNVADGNACDDGDLCTTGEVCVSGSCASGSPVSCSDANVCTTDTCDPSTGCQNATVADGLVCDDGNAATINDACQAGTCVGSGDGRTPCTPENAAVVCVTAVCSQDGFCV